MIFKARFLSSEIKGELGGGGIDLAGESHGNASLCTGCHVDTRLIFPW